MAVNTPSISLRYLVIGILGFGVLSIGTVIYSQWLTSRDFTENASLIRLTQTVQQEIATAHLWFEEALGGDTSIDLQADVHRRTFGHSRKSVETAGEHRLVRSVGRRAVGWTG
jgi:hypothetical protein